MKFENQWGGHIMLRELTEEEKAKPFAKFCTECRTVYEQEAAKRAKN